MSKQWPLDLLDNVGLLYDCAIRQMAALPGVQIARTDVAMDARCQV